MKRQDLENRIAQKRKLNIVFDNVPEDFFISGAMFVMAELFNSLLEFRVNDNIIVPIDELGKIFRITD